MRAARSHRYMLKLIDCQTLGASPGLLYYSLYLCSG